MSVTEDFVDFRSLSKLTLGIIYAFFLLQMLIFYWKNSLKAEGEIIRTWGGTLKDIAKAAHYEIIPSGLMFCVAIFTLSFDINAIFMFLVSIIGDTFIILGYHRHREGWEMLLLGRFLTHFSTLSVLGLAFIRTFANGSILIE